MAMLIYDGRTVFCQLKYRNIPFAGQEIECGSVFEDGASRPLFLEGSALKKKQAPV
jgi:hypothetical protein